MVKKLISIILTLIFLFVISVQSFAEELENIKILDKEQTIQRLKNESNGNLKLSEKNGQIFLSGKLSGKQTAGEKSAVKFLEDNKAIFEIDSVAKDLKIIEVKKDEIGDTFVKFTQIINGMPVNGSLINVHFDKNGAIVSVNGNIEKNKNITALGNGIVSSVDAIEIAKKQYTFKSLRNTPKAEKLVLTKEGKNYEVYKVNISYMEPKIENYDVFVETHSGKVIQTESNLRFDGPVKGSGIDVIGQTKNLDLYQSGTSYQMNDTTKTATSQIITYSLNNGTTTAYLVSNTTNYFNSEYYKASVSAHYNASKSIDFYKNLFGRNSLDNNGMPIKSYTHYGSNYNNAFWNGYEMVYGDGDGYNFTYLSGDLDVVGHEMTHGVTSQTANFYYHNQSGALDESMADIFGVLISTYDKYNVASGGSWTFNKADWVIGDDIYTPYTPGDALRSLSNPTLYNQPDNMSNYQYLPDTESGDNGGVHTNSGIPNKAAYLVAKNIGMEKTARIYYRALVNYMSSNTNFEGARNCLVQAATDLYGENSPEVTEVNNAFSLVGIEQASVTDPYEPNSTMETAYPINLGTKYQSYISSSTDVDFYRLNLSGTGVIRIDLSDLPGDYDLELYDSYGQLVKSSERSGITPELIYYDVYKTGNYYIKVKGYNSSYSATQKYSLTTNISSTSVTGVNLNQTTASLIVGKTITLVASVNPDNASNKDVTWNSSDTSVAIVDSIGNVTAVGNGTAKITVTTVDGNFTASCNVNVIAKALTGITVTSQPTKTQYVVGQSLDLTGLVVTGTYNDGTTTPITITSSNISGFNSSTTGSKTVTVTVDGKTATFNVNIILLAPEKLASTSTGYNSIKLSWPGVTGVSGYEVYKATSSTGTYTLLTSTTGLSYTNTGLTTNKTYYYKVRAYKTVGTTRVYSNYTAVVSAKPIPSVPTNFVVRKVSSTSTKLTWGSVTGASGYEIYRATSSSGTYTLLTRTISLGYTNTGLKANTTYYYKVRAYKTVGTTKVYSGYTTVVFVK